MMFAATLCLFLLRTIMYIIAVRWPVRLRNSNKPRLFDSSGRTRSWMSIDYLQIHLIKHHSGDLKENFANLHEIVFQHDSFQKLQKFVRHYSLPTWSESSSQMISILLSILRRVYLDMKESEILEHVIQWGYCANSTFRPFRTMKKRTFQNFTKYTSRMPPLNSFLSHLINWFLS